MQLLLIGSGGREHALAWKLAQDPRVGRIFIAPGNAGTAREPKCENIAIASDDISALLSFAQQQRIELTVVGPEAPLVAGISDRFNLAGLPIIGPSAAAARLEGSKCFSKAFMLQHKIPTAQAQSFDDYQKACVYLRSQPLPLVIKADGLAAGKGVSVVHSYDEGEAALHALLEEQRFGGAGNKLLIERFLPGTELSYIVLANGEAFLPLASSQDHKAVGAGDKGANTGGMGAYSPAPICTPSLTNRIHDEILRPTLAALSAAGTPYQGFLYLGLMINAEGAPHVIEYNCRLGDPETQPLLMRLESSLLELCLATLNDSLKHSHATWRKEPALGVVLASQGYPGTYPSALPITALPEELPGQKLFFAGVSQQDNQLVTAGGRVFCATALGHNLQMAQQSAYDLGQQIQFPGIFYRDDIGFKALPEVN